MLGNTAEGYGSATKLLHWGTAALILCILCIAFVMGEAEPLSDKLRLYNLHKSLGITVLTVTLLRLLWHAVSPKPALPATIAPLEKAAATGMHRVLYAFLLLMPLSGWIMSSAAGRAVNVFGLFTLPNLVGPDKALAKILASGHVFAGYTLAALAGLHIAAALKHHVIDRDATLRRMLPALMALALLLPAAARADAVTSWEVLYRESDISFSQDGRSPIPVVAYKTDIQFETARLSSSHINLFADLSNAFYPPQALETPQFRQSLNIAQAINREPSLANANFTLRSGKISKDGAKGLSMEVELTVNGVTQPIVIPLGAVVSTYYDKPKLTLTGRFSFDPRKFSSVSQPPPQGVARIEIDMRLVLLPGA